MKLNLSFAVIAAVAMALAAAPAEAQTKKKKGGKSQAAQVTVNKPAGGFWASQHQGCVSMWGGGMWFPVAAVGAVGCSVVYAVPVMTEGFMWPGRA